MSNRRPQQTGGRRMDYGRNDRNKNFGRTGVSPWQGAGPGGGIPNLLPLSQGSTEATLALASNIINLLQPRQNTVPSLLDMPIRRDFGPDLGRFDRGYGPNRMGNQGNFRRTGNYNRAGERVGNRKPYRPNDGPRQQNKSSPKKDADSKAKPVKESAEEQPEAEKSEKQPEEDKEGEKKEAPKTRYDDINPQLLRCHICNKNMWDGRSFENHLSGRAHAIMMQKTAESYALTADTMRQEIKIREMKRTRKSGQQTPRDFYCAMCDMYASDGAIHRTTLGHRRLKKYLHPNCTCCHKEMPTRIELDEHRLTAEHMRNFQEKQDVIAKPKPEVMVVSTLSMEQSYLREDLRRRGVGDHRRKGDADNSKEGDDQEKTEEKNESEEQPQEGEEEKKPTDKENTILDYKEGDDLSNITSDMFPAYSTSRGVGESFLSEFKCVQCQLCRKMLDSAETAAVHLRTWRHHQLFTRLLADKSGDKQKSQEKSELKRSIKTEESGNWKRRKTSPDHEQEQDDADDHVNGHSIKEEPRNEDEGEAQQGEGSGAAEGTGEGEVEEGGDEGIPPADELEDWEQSVDEILKDEQPEDTEDKLLEEEEMQAEKEPEVNPEPEPEPEPEHVPDVARGRGTPRGRAARGRRRARRGSY